MPSSHRVLYGCLLLACAVAGCATCCKQDPEERAGHPFEVSRCAHPSDTGRYDMYQVGGGSARHGDAPCPDDGTWGWDYFGLCLPVRVALDWFHGKKEQGGPGAYKTDGPRPAETLKGE
jgi:hypothetical protein